jgi:CheY-like chemotaxis protein
VPIGGLKKILVVDHSSLSRLQAKLALEKNGFTVLELDNANDYFRSLWNFTDVGLILLDFIHIPGLSGVDVLNRMKEYSCNPWPPVIIASHNPDAQMVASTIELGAKDCLIKPFNEADLCRRVERHFGNVKEFFIGKQLWSINLTSKGRALGNGIAVIDGNNVVGGTANFYFTGYCNLRSDPIAARLTVTLLAPGQSAFGPSFNSYTVVMHGSPKNEEFVLFGHMEEHPENQLTSVMKKLADF